MARLAAFIFASFGIGRALAAASSEEQLKGKLVRRHLEDSSEIRLGATGDMSLNNHRTPVVTTNSCNVEFFLLAAPTNLPGGSEEPVCPPYSEEVALEEDCFFAGAHAETFYPTTTALTLADEHTRTMTNHDVNPLPYVKNCLLHDGKVYFNPTDKNNKPPGTEDAPWVGQKICQRELYPRANKTSANPGGACPTYAAEHGGDFTPVTDFNQCTDVWFCDGGGASCRKPDFENNAAYKPEIYSTLPQGCFEHTDGCMDFNHIPAMPATVSDGALMCRPNRKYHPPPGPGIDWQRGAVDTCPDGVVRDPC